MGDQGKVLISMTAPVSTARGSAISGAGTCSATLKPVGILYEPTSSTETLGQVQIAGTALGLLGTGGATLGANLVSAADGSLIVQSTEADSLVCAVAMEAGSAGELRNVKII